ncbi:ATP-dependent endonuclease [Amycolatopsis japonica]|uniref:ATP-dependent nuclease n=1 Tax=Amycolatopsis japonica TaxID=208439 RepID=UPI00367117F5
MKVTNLKAIRHAELTQLDSQLFTVLTGQNASGKSTLLAAVHLLARCAAPEPQPDLVRLGAEEAEIEVAFSLTNGEFEQVDRYHRSTSGMPAQQQEHYVRVARIDKAGNTSYSGSPVAATVFDPHFRQRCRFPGVTLVHAERGRMPMFGVNAPGELVERHESSDYLTSRLTTLDYRSLLESRQSRPATDDYGDLARIFYEATNKRLLRPRPEGHAGTRIDVEVDDGRRHGLAGLSSGEVGLLGLLCTLFQSAADGGILLLDEPDVHLHPVLQSILMRTVRELAPRTQPLIVTHGVKIVASTPPSQVYQIRLDGANQARRATGSSSRVDVIADMGIEHADLLGKAAHLVVEGDRDENQLGRLFPDEMEHVHVTKAGDYKQVLAHHRVLADGPPSAPWLCLVDRDMMSEADVQQLQQNHPNLHIWPRRALESMVLEPTLLASVMDGVGHTISPDEADARLRAATDDLRGEVVTTMLHTALVCDFPPPPLDRNSGVRGIQEFYLANAQVMEDRSAAVPAIRARLDAEVKDRWEQERLILVDPKKVLGKLATNRSPFRSADDLLNALLTRAARDKSVRPPGLEDFRLRLARTIRVTPGDIWTET